MVRAQSLILRFPPRERVSSNRFTACNLYPIELKLYRMIPHIDSNNRWIFRFPSRVAPIEIFKSIHGLQNSSDLADSRMILDISPHNRGADSPISSQEVLWGRASSDLLIDSQSTVLTQLS